MPAIVGKFTQPFAGEFFCPLPSFLPYALSINQIEHRTFYAIFTYVRNYREAINEY